MKEALKKLKKHWALVWLVLAMVAASAFVTYAAYTGLKTVKRVVTTKSAPGDLFSSNSMNINISNKRVNSASFTVTVCNYDQNDPFTYNASNVTYVIEAELRVFHNNQYMTMAQLQIDAPTKYDECVALLAERNYSITKTVDDERGEIAPGDEEPHPLNAAGGYKYTFASDDLKKDNMSTDKFRVDFDNAELQNVSPDFYIYLKATPEGSYSPLEGLVSAAASTSDVSSWRGSFQESTSNKEYDFYNYILTGSGKGSVEIMWNPNYFEVNPFFYSEDSGNTITQPVPIEGDENNGWMKMTLTVDSSDKNRYEMQLYKTNSSASYAGSVCNNNIKCNYTPD